MKTLTFLFVALFLNFTVDKNKNAPPVKCDDFKTGKFELIDTRDNKRYIIERNESTQSEEAFDLTTGEVISKRFFIIKWTSDCEFNLMVDEAKSKSSEFEHYINSKGGLNNRIVSVEGNCANVQTSFEDLKVDSKMCKIK